METETGPPAFSSGGKSGNVARIGTGNRRETEARRKSFFLPEMVRRPYMTRHQGTEERPGGSAAQQDHGRRNRNRSGTDQQTGSAEETPAGRTGNATKGHQNRPGTENRQPDREQQPEQAKQAKRRNSQPGKQQPETPAARQGTEQTAGRTTGRRTEQATGSDRRHATRKHQQKRGNAARSDDR